MKFSRVSRTIAVYLALFLIASACYSGALPENYKQSPKGLEKQFEPFLKAYQKGDKVGQDEAFGSFRLPNAKAWFEQYFHQEDAQQLAWDVESEADVENASLGTMMNLVSRGARFRASCKPYKQAEQATVKPRMNSVVPVKQVTVEQFEIELQADGSNKRFSFLANFVYVDGAYRYVGKGAYPFWSMPDATGPDKH